MGVPADPAPAPAGSLRWTVLVYVVAWIVAVAVFAGLATATPSYGAPVAVRQGLPSAGIE
ncbi:MAG: hypothetical protein U1F15_15170 [Burkholderiales bacterium]